MEVTLIESYGSDLTCVNAARVSFANESQWEVYDVESVVDAEGRHVEYHDKVRLSDRDTKLVHYLAKHKHTSCFEHQGATLRLKVPIFIARQIQRHRTFSYNEISRRYVDTPPEFLVPEMRARAENVKQGSSSNQVENWEQYMNKYAALCANAQGFYEEMLEGGVAPEIARTILPQSMMTEFYMSGNLRSFSHFLHLRLDGHAQLEVQQVAQQVHDILQPLFPVSMEALMKYHA